MTARLTRIKTLEGFDFSFQPSLDRNRILALAELSFIERGEVVLSVAKGRDPAVLRDRDRVVQVEPALLADDQLS